MWLTDGEGFVDLLINSTVHTDARGNGYAPCTDPACKATHPHLLDAWHDSKHHRVFWPVVEGPELEQISAAQSLVKSRINEALASASGAGSDEAYRAHIKCLRRWQACRSALCAAQMAALGDMKSYGAHAGDCAG